MKHISRDFAPSARHAAVSLILVAAVFLSATAPAIAQDARVLTVDDVRRLALEYNRDYLTAQQEVERADARVVEARAGALPRIDGDAYYNYNFRVPTQFIEADGEPMEFQFGFKNAFGAGISLRQSIYQGGKVFTALSIARLYRDYTRAGAAEVGSDVVFNGEVLFYGAIFRQSQVAVLQKAIEAAEYNLSTIEKMRDQGMVSEFEVLRARVERNNLLPQLIAAESDVELARKRLKSFLGLELNALIDLVDTPAGADTSLAGLAPMDQYIDSALEARPAVQQAELLTEITRKAVKIAQADYWPHLEAVSNWGWSSQSDDFTLQENNSTSLTAGLIVSVPIFTGFERQGKVSQAKVDYNQSRLAESQTRDRVRLEVEEAYYQLQQAKKSLDIQGVNIEEAQEGLNIANVRYESGVGTLLEVLSAQVALTDARNANAEALFNFRVAEARLKRATTTQLNME